jgi:hypothetical protein
MLPSTLFIPLLKNASTWADNELRYALRSWEKYCPMERVIVIGHKPDWYTGEYHLLDGLRSKTEDIWMKTEAAARITDRFIFANDDHILLQPLTSLPYYSQGKLSDFVGGSDTFMRYVWNTAKQWPSGLYFDVHTPMIIESDRFLALEYLRDTLLKSIYCNSFTDIEGEPYKDCKINQHMRTEEIEQKLTGKKMFSFGDNGLGNDMRKHLFALFPDKSRFEL